MSDHQSEQHYNDLSVEQLFKEFKQAVEAHDTMTVESISNVVASWGATKKLEYSEWCRLTDEWRPGTAWDVHGATDTDSAADENFALNVDAPPSKPKLSFGAIQAMVKDAEYDHLSDNRTTVCRLNLHNGSTSVGYSQVLYSENNIPEEGEKAAYNNTFEKLWELAGYQHHQERYELALTRDAIIPGIFSMGDGADTQQALRDAWDKVSPAVREVAIQLQRTLMDHPVTKLRQEVAASSNRVSQWPSFDTIDEIEGHVDSMSMEDLRDVVRMLTAGYRNYCGHVAKQHSELLRENSRLSKEVANPITNYRLTSRINMTAGNHPDGTVQQLRRQGGLIRDEVVELLGHLHMDALFKFDFVKMATKFQDAWSEAVGYGAVFDDEMDAALNGAEEFLKLHEYQKTLFTGEDLPGATIDPYAIRDDIQDILVTTYGLSHYMGYNADEDHKEVYRSNMTKFDPTMELAKKTQEKYAALGVTTEIRLSHVKWEGFEGDYYINIVAETAVGTDGKTYPKGKFLKSINFEEPRYKPALRDLTVTSDHRLMAHYGEAQDAAEDAPAETQVDYSEVSPAVQETLNNPPDAYAGTPILERIVLHAPTHPGYFDDLRASAEQNAAFRAVAGRDMRAHEFRLATVLGGAKLGAIASQFEKAEDLPLETFGVDEEETVRALCALYKGVDLHLAGNSVPKTVKAFLQLAYQVHVMNEEHLTRQLVDAVKPMSEPAQEEHTTFDQLLDRAAGWLNAADNGTEFTGKLRSLKPGDKVLEVFDEHEKLFFTRINKTLLRREDGSSRELADFLFQITKLPPIRTEEEQ